MIARVPSGVTKRRRTPVLVIVVAWVLTWLYVRWANMHYDESIRGLRPAVPGTPKGVEGRP